jgi:peroxiredoxin
MKMHMKTPWNLQPVSRRVLNALGTLGLLLSLWGCAGERAPQSSFVLLDGSTLSTQQLQGKVSLVNFWATSCTTCVAEMPELVATYNKYKDRGYVTLAVAMSYDPPSYVVNFAQSRQLPFQVAIDNTGAVAREWGDVKLTPTTFLVNKRGEIVKRFVGTPDFAELHKLIDKLLAES